MTGDEFRTAVANSAGRWPAPPETWSYSSLREARECPRRWMLSRATYPALWLRRGYPPRLAPAAMLGEAVHRVVEVIIRALHSQGCTSLADPSAVTALRKLGGYSKIAEAAIQEQVSWLAGNPRASRRIEDLRAGLVAKVPLIRQSAQDLISRTAFQPAVQAPGTASPGERLPLAAGSHPEVELRAPTLRLAGRADLVTVTEDGCEITDYKTGSPDSHHADQLRMYALLWSRDEELNPGALPVKRLVIAYSSGDTPVTPPTRAELGQLAADLAKRISEAETWLRQRPPPARPSAPMCRMCGVRQLCDEYWASIAEPTQPEHAAGEPEVFDIEGTVTGHVGPRSWRVAADSVGLQDLIIRASPAAPSLSTGSRVRVLNLIREQDPGPLGPVVVMTGASEVFHVEPSA